MFKGSLLLAFTIGLTSLSCLAQVEIHFNTPKNFLHSDTNLEKKMEMYIDAAMPNSKSYMSFYQLKSKRIINAIERAHNRGVNFHIVMDDTALKKDYQESTDKLLKAVGNESVFICKTRGCINPDGNNHNKFYLFEKLQLGKNIVEHVSIQTSHNFKKAQRYNFNDMLVLKNNFQVYVNYLTYWEKLSSKEVNLDYMAGPQGTYSINDAHNTELFFSPSLSIDPYIDALKNFTCGNNGEILIMQSFFTESRGRAILKRLLEIKSNFPNCTIRAIVRNDKKHNDLKSEMKASGLDFHRIKRKRSLGISNHSKAMLLHDQSGKKVIYTGSMNITNRSLKGDETLIKIEDSKIYEQFKNYFLKMRRRTVGS